MIQCIYTIYTNHHQSVPIKTQYIFLFQSYYQHQYSISVIFTWVVLSWPIMVALMLRGPASSIWPYFIITQVTRIVERCPVGHLANIRDRGLPPALDVFPSLSLIILHHLLFLFLRPWARGLTGVFRSAEALVILHTIHYELPSGVTIIRGHDNARWSLHHSMQGYSTEVALTIHMSHGMQGGMWNTVRVWECLLNVSDTFLPFWTWARSKYGQKNRK